MSRTARLLSLLGWGIGIGAALYALTATGHGALSPPPVGSPERWQAWVEQRDPAAAAFAILRLVAGAGCWYLGVTTVVGAVLRLVRADVLVAFVDRVTVAPVRHLLAGSLTLTLAGIGPTAALAAAAPPPAPTTTTTTYTAASTSISTSTSTSVPAAVPGPGSTTDTITMRRLPAAGAEPDVSSTASAATGGRVDDRYTVVSGDCFWTIADDLLHLAWGRAPTDAEIVPYWLRLIEANRAELADPKNADLIFPGQIFTVPPPPPAPA
ncbi:MAG: resuscitation-promoting factor RpfA [Actinomycetota bacterium]|nr:resuscitation-promoting factor RpfA [Actinomycetota bacterium]